MYKNVIPYLKKNVCVSVCDRVEGGKMGAAHALRFLHHMGAARRSANPQNFYNIILVCGLAFLFTNSD